MLIRIGSLMSRPIASGGAAAAPTFWPVAGTYEGARTVEISSATAGAAIYYTTDGSDPTTASTEYSGPVSLAVGATTLRAIAVAGSAESTVSVSAYTILWSPAELTLAAWYDPSDLGTLWQDSARTIPVTTDGDEVWTVDDKSGNARHLVNAVVGRRPLYRTDGVRRWLEFDGSNDSLKASFTLPQPMTRIVGVKLRSWITSNFILDGGNTNAAILYTSSTVNRLTASSGTALATIVADGILDGIAISDVRDGASSAIQVGNNPERTGNAGATAAAGITIGATAAGTSGAPIDWFGAIVVASVMPSEDRAGARQWMQARVDGTAFLYGEVEWSPGETALWEAANNMEW